ncbi:hypothetical protein [Siminovitchia fordii]|uniref:Phage protein n=1 Tax=Siminovitchia fordii TaxID=254759 RepID=A0ABQ4KE07_9BACI|nr:hypothetical protein [Siminovitchia fordii]GIN23113.1 hypothetical protein J1TS3_42470 [Siminovitchia fordii]
MKDLRELYILGKPIDTKFGKVRFLKYHEYANNIESIQLISMNVLHIYYQYKKINKGDNPEINEEIENIKEHSLFEVALSIDYFIEAYLKIYRLVLDVEGGETEHIDNKIKEIFENEDNFMLMRSIVMDMNLIKEEEVNPNPEIQEYIEAGRELERANAEKQSFSDIASSIVVGSGLTYEDVANMSVLQVYATYYRIAQMQSYSTTVLYSTVAEKVKVDAWNKHIDLFETKKAGMKMSEFNKKYGSLFG